jgi:excinuclease ABC subunit C
MDELGPSALALGGPVPLGEVRGRRPGRLREGVRARCPRLPGVYGVVDGAGELVYVGKAKSLRARLLSYFRKGRDPKAGRIVAGARRLVWEVAPSEFAALLRELELIRRWQPHHNVQGRPNRRRRVYVCVGRRPAPYAFAAPRPPKTALACFGPVPGARRAREAVRRLNDWYRLRDCPQRQEMVFADQGELFPVVRAAGCLRHEIGNCVGPCAAACTQEDYAFHVRAALDFLEGKDRTPLEQLEREMVAASAALAFERAGALRDKLDALRWLSHHLGRLREAVRHSFVYAVPGHDGNEAWYLVRAGRACAAVPAPRDEAGWRVARAALEAVYARGVAGPTGVEEVDGVLLVASWFRRHPQERARTFSPATALAGEGEARVSWEKARAD